MVTSSLITVVASGTEAPIRVENGPVGNDGCVLTRKSLRAGAEAHTQRIPARTEGCIQVKMTRITFVRLYLVLLVLTT